MCVCVCARVMGVYSCNIHPYCESPDLTALLILLYVTEPVHLVQSPPPLLNPQPAHTQPSQHHTPFPSCLSPVEPCSVQISSPALQACLYDAGPSLLSSVLPHWLKILYYPTLPMQHRNTHVLFYSGIHSSICRLSLYKHEIVIIAL